MANALSKLEPYRNFIAAERRRHTPYRRIAKLLAEKGIQVDYSTIHSFVKVRSKPRRSVITMLDSEPANTTPAQAATQEIREALPTKPSNSDAQREAIERLKKAKPAARKKEKGLKSFDLDAPLERLSEEDARRELGEP